MVKKLQNIENQQTIETHQSSPKVLDSKRTSENNFQNRLRIFVDYPTHNSKTKQNAYHPIL
jgi:hypothetical protein